MARDPIEISNYWSDDSTLESIVLKDNKGYFVEIYREAKLVSTLRKGLSSLDKAEEVAENAVIENVWTEDRYAETR